MRFKFLCRFFFNLVASCDDLICGKNEICVAAGNTYQCVCDPDYEGENCEDIGWFSKSFFCIL